MRDERDTNIRWIWPHKSRHFEPVGSLSKGKEHILIEIYGVVGICEGET